MGELDLSGDEMYFFKIFNSSDDEVMVVAKMYASPLLIS
jgi:hypothetical protein